MVHFHAIGVRFCWEVKQRGSVRWKLILYDNINIASAINNLGADRIVSYVCDCIVIEQWYFNTAQYGSLAAITEK